MVLRENYNDKNNIQAPMLYARSVERSLGS